MKERETLLLNSFLGVDFTTSPLKVDPRRAVSGKNFMTDYGTMKKRPGWIELYKFIDKSVTAMYYFRGIEEFWLIRAGDKFYKVDQFFTTHSTLYTTAIATNENVQFFYQDGKVYITGCDKYLVMKETVIDGVPTYAITEVKDDAYIPLTTISIDDEAATNKSRSSLEPVNIITIKRKNSLIGRNAINLEWILDTSIRRSSSGIMSKVYVAIEYIDEGELKTKYYETFPTVTGLERYLFDKDEPSKILANAKGEFNLEVVGQEGTYYWDQTTQTDYDSAAIKWQFAATIGGNVTVEDANAIFPPTIDNWDYSQGDGVMRLEDIGLGYSYWRIKATPTIAPYGGYKRIKIYEETTPPVEGVDNIIVTFEAADTIDGSVVFTARHGIIFGVNGTSNQLFLSKNASEYYSKAYDFTYFPDIYTNTVGVKGNPIVGYHRLSDTSLIIYKDSKAGESRMYFRTMELATDQTTLFYEYLLFDKAVDENVGCDAEGSIANLSGDHLFLSHLGVYAVTLGQNIAVQMRHARERGMYVSKKIKSYSAIERSQAKAIVHDNRYYLCIGDDVFVADARYRTASDMDDTFNYEWFFWDNINARSWISVGDNLYFGTSEGRICLFDDEFSDRTLIRASEGDVMLTLTGGYLVYNQEITVKNDDLIKASVYQKHVAKEQITISGDEITASFNVENIFYEGMKVYIYDLADVSGLSEYTPYYIADLVDDTFRLFDGTSFVTPTGVFDILEDLSDMQIFVTEHDEVNNRFKLKRSTNGLPIEIINYTGQPITFVITLRAPVEMVWYSPIFDLGSNMWAKTLLGITISADASTTGAIDFGFDTRNISSNIQSLNYESFTFDDIDFNNFTFLTAIASSYTLRVKEKDFNFIILKFGSKTPTSAVINNVTVYYKINAMNRGIR